MIDEDSLEGFNTYFQEQSRQGVTQSTGHNTGFVGNGNVFFHSIRFSLNRNSERIARRFCLTAVLRGLRGASFDTNSGGVCCKR